jgi:hypothetical protein
LATSVPDDGRGKSGSLAGAAAVYIGAAVVLTWPLAINLTLRLGAPEGVGDPFLNLWILGWGLRAWVADPASVLAGRVFDANIFHPATGALTFSDHFLLQALALSPVYAVTGDAVLCYNLVVIASIALSGLAMHLFARSVTGSSPGAYAAGLAWAMWPYRTAHLFHLQLQALYFLPLALFFLHRLVAGRRMADAIGLGVMAGLQAIASVYYGVMTALTLVAASVMLAVGTGQWRSRRLLSRLAVGAVVGVIVAAPLVWPYVKTQRLYGFGRNLYEAANHAAALQSYTQVPPGNLVYGRTGWLSPRPPSPGEWNRSGVEHQMFPGLLIVALAGVGVWLGRRSDARLHVAAGVALVVTGVVLSLGPDGVRSLYAWLHSWVFGFEAIRAPARFAVIAMLGLAMLAAVGVAALERRLNPTVHWSGGSACSLIRRTWRNPTRVRADGSSTQENRGVTLGARLRGAWLAAPLALIALEYVNTPLPFVDAPARQTPTGQWLRSSAPTGAVLYLPIGPDVENTTFMVRSMEHWRPIVNGYSGQRPAFFSGVVESLSEFPSPDAYAMLRELDVKFVVSPESVDGSGSAASPLVERARLPDGVVYEVIWTPDAEAAMEIATAEAPPAPGPLPFEPGERLTYEVAWVGGPLDLPAGRATLTADHANVGEGRGPRARWTFEATAETADWVSRFFEARDRFWTLADEGLLPIEHTRSIREGRRRMDEAYLFDAEARVVRLGATRAEAAGAGVAFPAPPEVRDALTTFYYVRTLPLAEGTELALPVNDGGRNMALRIRVVGYETVPYRGGLLRALRLEPQVVRRLERRQPLTMTVWLSDDGRRVPLTVEVAAGFGRIRANLVGYRQ